MPTINSVMSDVMLLTDYQKEKFLVNITDYPYYVVVSDLTNSSGSPILYMSNTYRVFYYLGTSSVLSASSRGLTRKFFPENYMGEYKNLEFPLENEKTIVDFKLIRNGLNYYFEINGYHYQYESIEEKPTYPGFFSQNQSAEIKNYQVNYDQKCVDEAIEKEWNDNSKLDILKFLEKDSTSIKAGESRSFNVVKAPEYAKENYVFYVNEEYKDFVVIENNLIKVNENAPEGLLEVTLSSESKKITDKYSIQITKDVQITENDYILATGGSYLSSSNSIVFPEALFENNGIGNETKYDSSPTYGAILKQKVYGCSFTLEFDVNNYNGHGQEKNNLLISLGGRFNQYYFSFGNGVANVNVYTQSLKQNRTNEGSNIIANQLSGLDGNNHHVRINTNEGTIEITIDNK